MIVNQWKDTLTKVYAPTAGDAYDYTLVPTGPGVNVSNFQVMITNADQGAMLSWQLTLGIYCALATDSGCIGGYPGLSIESHLTGTTGGSVTSDVVMNQVVAAQSAVLPVLQLQDGSYVGQALSNFGAQSMVAFDASGNVNWVVPGYNADLATADGGIVADTGTVCGPSGCGPGNAITFDANGNATGQIVSSPEESWTGESYNSLGGSISDTGQQPFNVDVTSYVATAGGNPSQNGTAVPECPCEVQTGTTNTASNFSFPKVEFARDFAGGTGFAGSRLMLASYPANRVALRSPFPTFAKRAMFAPQSGGGNQVTDLLLVGEPGKTGNNFETAAQTVASVANLYATNPPNPSNKSLIASGDHVIPGDPAANPAFPNPYFIQVFDVSDVQTQLTNNNLISGQVMLFMHGGTNRSGQSALFPNQGNTSGNGPNISDATVGMLQSAAAFVGPKATVTL